MGRIGSAQLCFGMLAVLAIVVYIPSTHGKPFLLQGKLKGRHALLTQVGARLCWSSICFAFLLATIRAH